MKTSKVYCIETSYPLDTLKFKSSETHKAYFTNLSVAFRIILGNLVVKKWPSERLNYTKIYRDIVEKKQSIISIKLKGSTILRIKITQSVINNPLEGLGIDQCPI